MGEHALQRPPSYRTKTSEPLWHLDRQILPIPPLLPRPDEVAQVRIAEQAQRQVGVRGAVPTLSKGHDGVVRVHTRRGVHGPQLLGRFESAVSVQIMDPFQMHRSRDRATTRRTDIFGEVLLVRAGIEERQRVSAQQGMQVIGTDVERLAHVRLELHLTHPRRFGGDGIAGSLPGVKTAVQHMRVRMAQVFQEPETTRRPHAGDAFVKDHGFVQIDAALLEQVLHHPHKRGQGFGAGIVQRDAIEIEMHHARYPTLGIGGGGAYVDDGQVGITEPPMQLLWRPEQVRVRIAFSGHAVTSCVIQGAGYQRSSYSDHRPLRYGITSCAKRWVFSRASASGKSPICSRSMRCPTRIVVMALCNVSRTVAALPAITKPCFTKSFQVSWARSALAAPPTCGTKPARSVACVR